MSNQKLKEVFEKIKFQFENGTEKEKKAAYEFLQFLKSGVQDIELQYFRAQYIKYSNPLYALCAYKYARKEKLEIPNWVYEYLDNAVASIFITCKSDSERLDRKLPKAIGITQKKISQFNDFDTKIQVHELIIEKRSDTPHGKKNSIYEDVANDLKLNVTEHTIKNYNKEINDFAKYYLKE